MTLLSFLEILRRAESGPVCEAKQWDTLISRKVRSIIEERGLKGRYDPQNPINVSDSVADDFFEAGFDLALDVGMYCLDTERVIKFDEEEIREVLGEPVYSIVLGKRPDEAFLRARKPEDPTPPTPFFGPLGMTIDEDVWIPLHQSTAQYRVIDGLVPGSLGTIYGIEIAARTPIETLAGMYEAVLTKEAVRRAGRPNMALTGVETSPSEYGHFGGYGVPGGYGTTDVNIVLAVSELKTHYTLLHKVAHILNLGAPIYSGHRSMIGGFPGPPEGAAVVAVAAAILLMLVHQATMPGGSTFDTRYCCNTSREAVWADSVSGQAQSRHITRPLEGVFSPLAGPCTEMLLYESAAIGLSVVVSGRSLLWGVRSAGGAHKNHSTGLENKFAAEVAKAAAGMKRSEANEIVKKILPKYETKLRNAPPGKSFLECYDPVKMRPSREWAEIYNSVRKEITDWGIPI